MSILERAKAQMLEIGCSITKILISEWGHPPVLFYQCIPIGDDPEECNPHGAVLIINDQAWVEGLKSLGITDPHWLYAREGRIAGVPFERNGGKAHNILMAYDMHHRWIREEVMILEH